ncbi:MAG TPA: hypothetical protein VFG68_05785 [Fimbriiglobus sp.]|nr:hypothetical protein [Fimbriiglobus sp.]
MDHSVPPPEPAQGHELTTAAAPHRVGRWSAELGWHLLAATVTVGVLFAGLRLDKADLHAPFTYENDALLILPLVKAALDRGSHWRNERLGAPGIQELHDFPVVDHLHFGIIWVMGQFFPDPVVVFNLFYLLTYPLTTLTGMFVLRRLGLSVSAAAAGGLLYAFQPYHYLRGQMHYFLAAYYVVPLTVLVTLWVCRGRLPFFEKGPDGRYRFRARTADSLTAVLIAVATASAGAYYAFFGCALLACAGVYAWATLRTWRGLASASLVIAVIFVAGLVNHAPTFPYEYRYGHNSRPHARLAEDAERYGLKIAQLVLPVAQHNPVGIGNDVWFDPAAVRSMYQAPTFKELNEAEWDPIGLVAALGYVLLLAAAVVPVRRRWPVGPLVALTVFATLLGTLGGFGAVFNLLVSSQVRCYNRISIIIAFLALFFVCWLIDRFFDTRVGWARRLRVPAFLAVAAFGVWDQTNESWFPDLRTRKNGYVGTDEARETTARKFWQDREFFEKVEAVLGDGAMVFTYPYIEFPEGPPYFEFGSPGKIESYDMVRGYLHSRTLRWSFGAMKGREWDTWMRDVAGSWANREQFLARLVSAGFEGLLVDTRGLNPKNFAELKVAIERPGGSLREVHPDGHLYFFDLRGHREYLRRNFGTAQFEAMIRREYESMLVLWLSGFNCYEPVGYEWRSHWCGKSGQLVFVNRCDHARTVVATMQFRTVFKNTAQLRISGEVWSDELEIGPADRPVEYAVKLVIPPGRHTIRFRCTPAVSVLPTDSRRELFTINNFKLAEAPADP